MDKEMTKLRTQCTSQRAAISDLEIRYSRASADTKLLNGSTVTTTTSTRPEATKVDGQQRPPSSSARSTGHGRMGGLRILLERFREAGVRAHGMLADLVLLRRQRDETAVVAALGSALRSTIVVQTRRDGGRVVAGVRAAGICGQVRCDILDEMKGQLTPVVGGGARQHGKIFEHTPTCITTKEIIFKHNMLLDNRHYILCACRFFCRCL